VIYCVALGMAQADRQNGSSAIADFLISGEADLVIFF
jgi:hypothetical protein